MIRVINLCQDAALRESTKMKLPFLPFDEPILCNDYISRNQEYNDRFCINFPCHCGLNRVDSDTDLLDNVLLTKFIL